MPTALHPAVHDRGGHGLPLLMVHGLGGDHRILEPLDHALAPGLRRIYIDLPGMGSSPALAGVGGLPEVATWLQEQVASLVGTAPFALLGHSLGGLLAQEMADRFPGQVRGLALLAPVVYPGQAERTLPAQHVFQEDVALLAALDPQDADTYRQMAVLQTPGNWELFRRAALPGIRAARLRALAKISRRYTLPELPVHRTWAHDFPVMILCGAADHVTGWEDPQRLLSRYPQARYEVLRRAGHNLHLDQPETVSQLLAAWAVRVQDF